MKALKCFFLSALIGGSGGAFAGEIDAQAMLEDLKQAMEDDLIELTDQSITSCADFSGSWAGTCTVKVERGGDVVNITEMKNIAIAQEGCHKVDIDDQKYAINVAANNTFSSAMGFLHAQGGLYWKDGGQTLGLGKEMQGMTFKAGSAYKKFAKMATLKAGADTGTAQLDAVIVLKKYKDDKGGEMIEKVKATYSCPLSLGATHH